MSEDGFARAAAHATVDVLATFDERRKNFKIPTPKARLAYLNLLANVDDDDPIKNELLKHYGRYCFNHDAINIGRTRSRILSNRRSRLKFIKRGMSFFEMFRYADEEIIDSYKKVQNLIIINNLVEGDYKEQVVRNLTAEQLEYLIKIEHDKYFNRKLNLSEINYLLSFLRLKLFNKE